MSYKNFLEQLPELELFHDKELNLTMSYRYRKEDNNIPILFLHGFNGNSKSWAYQFNFFKNKRSVIAIDAPGFGKSSPAVLRYGRNCRHGFSIIKSYEYICMPSCRTFYGGNVSSNN